MMVSRALLAIVGFAVISIASAEFNSAQGMTDATPYVLLSYASYCPFDVIRNFSCYWCTKPSVPALQGVKTIYNGSYDIFAYAGYSSSSRSIYLTFRGTAAVSIKDWIKNLQFTQITPWSDQPSSQVHKGFYTAWSSIRSLVFSALSGLKQSCGGCKLVVTGHSLGGAMATLASVDLARAGINVDTLFTLGSPRTGNPAFATYFSTMLGRSIGSSSRLVNNGDIVPQVPFRTFDYHHATRENWIRNGQYVVCDNSGEDPSCADSLNPLQYSVNDHTSYLGIDLHQARAFHCDGIYDNKGPPGSQKRS
jgi:hypothetical protein